MDIDWCLTCGRQTVSLHTAPRVSDSRETCFRFMQNEDNKAYCSKTCMTLDRNMVVQSLPVHMEPYRHSFNVSDTSPSRRTTPNRFQTRRETRARTGDGSSKRSRYTNARFNDDELREESRSSTVVASRWSGRDHEGILVWAHSVLPGLDEECVSPILDAPSISDLDGFYSRPPPFPLTTQNLAPPFVTIPSRHALLNHTSSHYLSHREDPTAPSTSQDDTSLLSPATDSVITPSAPSRPDAAPSPSSRVPRLGFLVNAVCSLIASPLRAPRVSSEGNPLSSNSVEGQTGQGAGYYVSPYGGGKSMTGAVVPPASSLGPAAMTTFGSRDSLQ